MLPVSPGFLEALASPQQVTVRADVSKAGQRLFSGLPVVGGSIHVDTTSITRRRLSMQVAPMLRTGTYTERPALPGAAEDPLGHYGQEISVNWGLTYPSGVTEWLPLGVFRIDGHDGSLLHDDVVTVTGVSREAFVADARFINPRTASSPSALALIATLIHEVLPGVEVVAQTTQDRRVPMTTWDEDRWAAITDLAESIGAVVYADPHGRFVIADAPTVDTPPVWRVTAGPGGVLVSARRSGSRSQVYNAVVVRAESTTGIAVPAQAVARDTGANSPTRWGDPSTGAFGMVPRFMFIPTITDITQARRVAVAQLTRTVGAASSLDLSTVPNPALEAGDVIEVLPDPSAPAGRGVLRHVVDAFTVPLVAGGEFPMATRDLTDVAAEVSSA